MSPGMPTAGHWQAGARTCPGPSESAQAKSGIVFPAYSPEHQPEPKLGEATALDKLTRSLRNLNLVATRNLKLSRNLRLATSS
jgi:hypothetical protein